MPVKIALAGNPNCGKTTLFNALTGSRQYVGNWPGVTVERKSGRTKSGSEVVDLPGIYSLSPYSMEERVAQEYILHAHPDVIIDIVDGTNIERNLYLTLQLLELERPVVVAVNMMDDVRARGWRFDCDALSRSLGVPVIPIAARTGENVGEVLRQAESLGVSGSAKPRIKSGGLRYNQETERVLTEIRRIVMEGSRRASEPVWTFHLTRLLEGDPDIESTLQLGQRQRQQIREAAERYGKNSSLPGADRETCLADARYRLIEQIVGNAVEKGARSSQSTLSDRIDRVVTNRLLAIPIFLLIMLLMFLLVFGPIGRTLGGWMTAFFTDILTPAVRGILDSANAPGWTYGLLIDAVIGGVGSVLGFLPQIMLLFLCLSLLEDSGYMARAAFIMDRLLHKIGLSGKSFIPMLMGFGCTTPAVMAARTMENEKDRRMTIMITPFMSCGARLPIYALFAGVFFQANQGLIVFSMYLLGLAVAILSGLLLRHTLFRGEAAPFVLELPPYRLPGAVSILRHMWEKAKGFLVKAGTIIFSMSVVIWFCETFTLSLHPASSGMDSILGQLGQWIAPVFTPLGFGFWQAAVALLAGLVAKESVVTTLGVLFAGQSLPVALGQVFTPLSAYAFMVFTLLYIPCISAFASIKREMNSLKWALGTALLQLSAAYLVSLCVYQIGHLLI